MHRNLSPQKSHARAAKSGFVRKSIPHPQSPSILMSISCREATGRPIAVQFRRRGLNASASARKKKAEGLDGELVLVCASAGNANKALNTAPETPASRTRLRQAKACCTGGRRPRRLFVFAAHGPPGVARTLHVCASCTRQTARGALSASTGLPLLSSRAKRAPLSQLHVGHGKQANPETRSVVRRLAHPPPSWSALQPISRRCAVSGFHDVDAVMKAAEGNLKTAALTALAHQAFLRR